jgi:hypothetical protein
VKVDVATRRLGRNKRTAMPPLAAHGPQSYEIPVEPSGSHSCCGSAAGPDVHHGGKTRNACSGRRRSCQTDLRQAPVDYQSISPPDARPAGKDGVGHELVSHHLGAAAYEKLRSTSEYTRQIRTASDNSRSLLTRATRRDSLQCKFVQSLRKGTVVTTLAGRARTLYCLYIHAQTEL